MHICHHQRWSTVDTYTRGLSHWKQKWCGMIWPHHQPSLACWNTGAAKRSRDFRLLCAASAATELHSAWRSWKVEHQEFTRCANGGSAFGDCAQMCGSLCALPPPHPLRASDFFHVWLLSAIIGIKCKTFIPGQKIAWGGNRWANR